VDGIVISGTERADPRIDLLATSNIHFMSFGRTESEHEFSWVDLDFEGVAENAIDRHVSRGHSCIALTVPFGDLNFGKLAYNQPSCARGPQGSDQFGTAGSESAWAYGLIFVLQRRGNPRKLTHLRGSRCRISARPDEGPSITPSI